MKKLTSGFFGWLFLSHTYYTKLSAIPLPIYPNTCGTLVTASQKDIVESLRLANLTESNIQRLLSNPDSAEVTRAYAIAMYEISNLPKEFFDRLKTALTDPAVTEQPYPSDVVYFEKLRERQKILTTETAENFDLYPRNLAIVRQAATGKLSSTTISVIASGLLNYSTVKSYYCEMTTAGLTAHLEFSAGKLFNNLVKMIPYAKTDLRESGKKQFPSRNRILKADHQIKLKAVSRLVIPEYVKDALAFLDGISPATLQNLIETRTLLKFAIDDANQKMDEAVRRGDTALNAEFRSSQIELLEILYGPTENAEKILNADVKGDLIAKIVRELKLLSNTAYKLELEKYAVSEADAEDLVEKFNFENIEAEVGDDSPRVIIEQENIKRKLKSRPVQGPDFQEKIPVTFNEDVLEDTSKWGDHKILKLFEGVCLNPKSFRKFFNDIRDDKVKKVIVKAIYLLSQQAKINDIPFVRSERKGIYAIKPRGTSFRVFLGFGSSGIKVISGYDNVKASEAQQTRIINEVLEIWNRNK